MVYLSVFVFVVVVVIPLFDALLIVPVGAVSPFWPGDSPFPAVRWKGGACRTCRKCPKSRDRRLRALPFGICTACKLR